MLNILLITKFKSSATSLRSYLEVGNRVVCQHPTINGNCTDNIQNMDAVIIAEDADKCFISLVVDRVCSQNVRLPIVVYSSQADLNFVVSMMKKGIDDYVLKSHNNFLQLESTIAHYIEKYFPQYDKERDQSIAHVAPEIIGVSKSVERMKRFILHCAASDVIVVLCGESGTGKTFIARSLHQYSERHGQIFRALNCAAVPDPLLESEMFGSEVGAFTGAVRRHGVLTHTHRGTLFLDEIGDLSLASQAKLLHVLEGGSYTPLGGNQECMVDVRIIVATNKDIRQMVLDKKFREDLYYRLWVFPYTLPPLRDRKEDIVHLSHSFVKSCAPTSFLRADAIDKLENHSWPGNIRELSNCIKRAAVMSRGSAITAKHIVFYSI